MTWPILIATSIFRPYQARVSHCFCKSVNLKFHRYIYIYIFYCNGRNFLDKKKYANKPKFPVAIKTKPLEPPSWGGEHGHEICRLQDYFPSPIKIKICSVRFHFKKKNQLTDTLFTFAKNPRTIQAYTASTQCKLRQQLWSQQRYYADTD